MRVVVTGARGFVGRFVVAALAERGVEIVALERSARGEGDRHVRAQYVADPDTPAAALERTLASADAVVHLAAAVHDVRGRVPAQLMQRVNRDYTLRLARAALFAGVRRFVFVSSVKVNTETTARGEVLDERAAVRPRGAYAVSKWQAEQGLAELGAELPSVSVRSPLVYGPGVRANFARLMRAVERGWPLPLGAVDNRRSLVYVENLADLWARLACEPWPLPGARVYFAGDAESLSTAELVRRLARELAVAPRLVPVPEPIVRAALVGLGQRGLAERLLGSLEVSAERARIELGWTPPWSVDEGLARTARWYTARRETARWYRAR